MYFCSFFFLFLLCFCPLFIFPNSCFMSFLLLSNHLCVFLFIARLLDNVTVVVFFFPFLCSCKANMRIALCLGRYFSWHSLLQYTIMNHTTPCTLSQACVIKNLTTTWTHLLLSSLGDVRFMEFAKIITRDLFLEIAYCNSPLLAWQ